MLQSGYDSLRGICENVSNRYVTAVFNEKCFNRAVFDYILYEKRNTQYVANYIIHFCMICALLSMIKNKDDWVWSLNRCVQDYNLLVSPTFNPTDFMDVRENKMSNVEHKMSPRHRHNIFIKCRGSTRNVECRWTLQYLMTKWHIATTKYGKLSSRGH